MDYIVQPRTPIHEIAIVLLAWMWKIHVCVFVEGKYWTTNKDEARHKATIYLVYLGKNVFCDTTKKGSLHWSLMEQPESDYNLRKPKPKLIEEPKNTPPTPSGHKTLNTLHAGLIDEKSKCAAMREYRHLYPKPESVPKLDHKKPKKPTGSLRVQQHGILKWMPRTQKFKCPVVVLISAEFQYIKDLNAHVWTKHKCFCFICGHCTRKFLNYYKHQKTHMAAPHICKVCCKGFWFPMNLTVHDILIHTKDCSDVQIVQITIQRMLLWTHIE